MRVYIAAPFFNPAQLAIVFRIERLLSERGFEFYSPRIHSGSADMTPEQRKNSKAWEPVFQSNVQELMNADLVLAVLEYALPDDQRLVLQKRNTAGLDWMPVASPELPDAGVVWELGAAWMVAEADSRWRSPKDARIPFTIGFHSRESAKLNLMLSHSVNGMLIGWNNLERFFDCNEKLDWKAVSRFEGEVE